MPTRDLALIIALTTACCVLVGLIGLIAVRLLRRRPLRLTVVVAGLVPVLAVAISVLVNVNAMFLSGHDSFVVLVALGWAVVIAGGLTVVVGHSVSAGALAVREGMRLLGNPEDRISAPPASDLRRPRSRSDRSRPDASGSGAAPAELAALVAELDVIRERLNTSRTREKALEQSRRELVAFMSHDLRTPLAGLRALAEGVEDGVVGDVPAAMTRIRSTVDRLSLLVNDLFELSRVTGGGHQRPRRLVSLAEVAMDVLTEVSDHARACGVQLLYDLPEPDDRLPVLGDADELIRAMTNLVANAVRHTQPGGTVQLIGNRGADGQIRIAVVDGCGGIPDADLAHVFEAGWRGNPARTPDDGGAGLGLAIARGVVESHEGSILVRNIDGGCLFELALPLAQ
ncbi:MAG TPA: HAMP domain-containing sensor histidine kinase [Kineosporiaceae bacterium]|nr:HAMP domain-containing sensor histidine kinase [Kineosporiaceae bacterium]